MGADHQATTALGRGRHLPRRSTAVLLVGFLVAAVVVALPSAAATALTSRQRRLTAFSGPCRRSAGRQASPMTGAIRIILIPKKVADAGLSRRSDHARDYFQEHCRRRLRCRRQGRRPGKETTPRSRPAVPAQWSERLVFKLAMACTPQAVHQRHRRWQLPAEVGVAPLPAARARYCLQDAAHRAAHQQPGGRRTEQLDAGSVVPTRMQVGTMGVFASNSRRHIAAARSSTRSTLGDEARAPDLQNEVGATASGEAARSTSSSATSRIPGRNGQAQRWVDAARRRRRCKRRRVASAIGSTVGPAVDLVLGPSRVRDFRCSRSPPRATS